LREESIYDVRQEEFDIAQLAVDTHGHTDFAMALAKLLGFDLCPRLKALKDRHLFLPRGTAILASRGDPLYEAVVHPGRLLRTVFLCDYFLNDVFRRELLRVLNRGEAVNALKRAIYTGRVASYQAKQPEEMQAVADALSLLANIVMAWNTAQMQQALERWAQCPSAAVPPELIGRIAPTRTEGINLRGILRFPVDRFADKNLPSGSASKMTVEAS
jgi:TnpA family transposase